MQGARLFAYNPLLTTHSHYGIIEQKAVCNPNNKAQFPKSLQFNGRAIPISPRDTVGDLAKRLCEPGGFKHPGIILNNSDNFDYVLYDPCAGSDLFFDEWVYNSGSFTSLATVHADINLNKVKCIGFKVGDTKIICKKLNNDTKLKWSYNDEGEVVTKRDVFSNTTGSTQSALAAQIPQHLRPYFSSNVTRVDVGIPTSETYYRVNIWAKKTKLPTG